MRHRSFYPRPSTVDDELRTLKITAAQRLTGFMGHRVNENLDRGFIGESVQFASAHIYIYTFASTGLSLYLHGVLNGPRGWWKLLITPRRPEVIEFFVFYGSLRGNFAFNDI